MSSCSAGVYIIIGNVIDEVSPKGLTVLLWRGARFSAFMPRHLSAIMGYNQLKIPQAIANTAKDGVRFDACGCAT